MPCDSLSFPIRVRPKIDIVHFFARLLQYRAFKEIAATFAERISLAEKSFARTTALDAHFASLLPEVLIGVGPERFAVIADRVLFPKAPPVVSVEHIHRPLVNVAEQSKFVVAALRLAKHLSFRALVQDAEEPMVVVARFLALLDLYRSGSLRFEQLEAFMEQHVYPREREHHDFVMDPQNLWKQPPVVEELKVKAREAGKPVVEALIIRDVGDGFVAGLAVVFLAPFRAALALALRGPETKTV